jgi:hypothetical protein
MTGDIMVRNGIAQTNNLQANWILGLRKLAATGWLSTSGISPWPEHL